MDRLAPTRRPPGRPVGYQRWRELLFLHWTVPAATLRPLVPRRLAIDEYEGQAFVGLVPFRMEGVRQAWMPERAALDFLETNVRTYVHLDGEHPGVYFFSLDAASRLAVWVARAAWALPYFFARMEMTLGEGGTEYRLERRSGTRPGLHVRYRPGEPLGPSAPGSLEFFLLERYFLYAERGGLLRGQVHHMPYPAQRASVVELHEDLIASAGLSHPDTAPLAHYAPGVDVEIFPLVRVPG
ncbi:MAG TPA: DUF2071 domain-containing protein [Polyangia bacterium]|nr:DUF2071 domain-containing protein [Polyangia bacterium]